MELTPVTREMDAWMMNPLQLAYIGDTVWDLLVRTRLITTGHNVHKLHVQATQRVNAGAQAQVLMAIKDQLTDKEAELVNRGRNSKARHGAPKNQDPAAYQQATGFEALLGYLYLTGQRQRLDELFSYAKTKEAL